MIPTHAEPATSDQVPHAPHGLQVYTTETIIPSSTETQRRSSTETQRRLENLITGKQEKEREPVATGHKKEVVETRKGNLMPYGKARHDVRRAIEEFAPIDQPFNQHDVWRWLDPHTQSEWVFYYGSHQLALSRMASTMNSIFTKVPNREFDLIKVKKKAATYTYRPKSWRVKEAAEELVDTPPPTIDKAGATKMKAPPLDGYTLFGKTVDDVPLYMADDGELGYIQFIPIGIIEGDVE